MGKVYFKRFRNKDGKISQDEIKLRLRSFLFGYGGKMGFVKSALTYGLLCIFGFVYLYPILYMLATSFKSLNDLLDTTVNWIPKEFTVSNYTQAFKSLHVSSVIKDSILLALIPSIGQIITCSLTGYALQRFRFPGKKLVFTILIITFILPTQVLMPSTYQILLQYKLIGSMLAFIIPAFLGQGLKSAILVLIFYQFFKTIPRVLDEAAQLDGAGHFRIFYKIGIRAAAPAYIVAFLLSIVWYWNETYLTSIYMGNAAKSAKSITTLLLELRNFAYNFDQLYGQSTSMAAGSYSSVNESIKAAAVLITIIPILILYFVMQKYFVEGVEKTGITGE
ncbi:MAG: transporter permease [Herbinix sp.]|jgi:multiple sugar transport system permease protein|nr:transporter permease [Herbinix sp.]